MKRDITILLDTAALCALNHPRGADYTLTNDDVNAGERALGRGLSTSEMFRLETLIQSYLESDMVDAHAARVKIALA